MNSRQRRKAEAHKHNMLIIEKDAYAEDKRRYPEKYNPRFRVDDDGRFRRKQLAAITAIMLSAAL
jgi:hypothetical protein